MTASLPSPGPGQPPGRASLHAAPYLGHWDSGPGPDAGAGSSGGASPSNRRQPRRVLAAVATGDPLDPGTFSGYSHHLFRALQAHGWGLVPLASRNLKWYDVFTGAISPRALFPRDQGRERAQSRISPDWYWSRDSYERFSRRIVPELMTSGATHVLQVGTHIRTDSTGLPSAVVTDCTVIQAIDAGEFAVSRSSAKVIEEAIACQRDTFHSCERVFTLSAWAARSVIHDYGVPVSRVVAVGAGANLPRLLPRNIDRERPTILLVGRDWEQKGGPLLLEAFHRVRRAVPNARLVSVGCGPPFDVPGVEVAGRIDKAVPAELDRLLSLYSSATCLALLSRFDAFPNVVIEAASMGLPTVAIDEGSRPEQILHGQTGLLAQRDPDDVADALIALLTDPDRANTLGGAAREHIHAMGWTWPQVAERISEELDA